MELENSITGKDYANEIERLKSKFSDTNHKASSLDTRIMLDIISYCVNEIKTLKGQK